jgi:S1-C subfamily serine protease
VGTQSWQYANGQRVSAKTIEFDGSILPGNSGSPVVNDDGELVGIVAAHENNIGFAIHLEELKTMLHGEKPRLVLSK